MDIKKILRRSKKRTLPKEFAVISWKNIHDRVPVNDDMLREIRTYINGKLAQIDEYSESAVDIIREHGIPAKDETRKFPNWITGKRDLGEVPWG